MTSTAGMDDAGKSTWFREHGTYPGELRKERANTTAWLAELEETYASPQAMRQDKKRIKELVWDLLPKTGF